MSASSTPPLPQRDVIQRLEAAPLFRGFTETGLQIIASIGQSKSLPAGSPLFVENMIGDSLYVVAEGTVQLMVKAPGGDEVALSEVCAPDTLGEAALLRAGPRQCSAIAQTPCQVVEIARRDLAALQRTKPQACLKLMMAVVEVVGDRLRDAEPDLKRLLLAGLE